MRPDVLVGPSEWVVEQFGGKVAAELWTRVPEALSTAIDREVTAHPAMTTTTERVLANPRWPLPYEELVLFLGTLPGAEIISVPKSVYQLVVINGHVVVPWCYGQSARMSMGDAEVGRSFGRLARELLRRFGPPWKRSQAEAPLPLDAVDEREVSKKPTDSQKAESPVLRLSHCGLTQSSKEPVSSWTNCGCGGEPMLTVAVC